MTASELAALVKGLAPAVLQVVTREVSPVSERVAVLETKASLAPDLEAIAKQAAELIPVPTNGQDGADGKDADPALVTELRDEIRSLRIELMELKAVAGLAADVELLRNAVSGIGGAIQDSVAEAIAALPVPTNGVDGKDAEPVDLDAVAIQAAALIPVPKDGLSVTVEDVAPLVVSEVQKAVSALPVPKDGKDGVGMAGVFLGKDGACMVTLTDGTVRDLGVIVGHDGAPGKDGAKGLDGVGFDDLSHEYDERGHLWIVMAKGEQVHRMRVPGHVDRGVYKQGEAYLSGEGTTWGGSYWLAQRDTTEKPGEGSKDWRLSVKRGGDGKVGPQGPQGEKGLRGDPGPMGPARY